MALHQPLDDGLLDDALAGGHAGQLAVQGGALHREGGVCRQQLLPGDGVDPVEQVVKGLGLVVGQQQHHPLHRPEVQVGGGDHLSPAPEGQPAIGDPQVLSAQPLELKAGGGLAAKKAGCNQFVHCRHGDILSFAAKGARPCRGARQGCLARFPLGQARVIWWNFEPDQRPPRRFREA